MTCSSSDVFAIDYGDGTSEPNFTSNFPVDMVMTKYVGGGDTSISARLTQGKYLLTNSTAAEATGTRFAFDYMDGWDSSVNSTSDISWMWKRATGFFDVVCYTGDGLAGRTVAHNLGVVPEMIWIKRRNIGSNWQTYDAPSGNTNYMVLNESQGTYPNSTAWNNTTPTDTVFTLGTENNGNISGGTFIAYLFATLPGISKVGSYTGNGTNQTLDCGFAAGAKFVLIKRTDNTGDWYIWDSVRGIVAGNDPHLSLNTTAAEVTSDDSIDPDTTGFIVNQVAATNINVNSAEYIFYAIAI